MKSLVFLLPLVAAACLTGGSVRASSETISNAVGLYPALFKSAPDPVFVGAIEGAAREIPRVEAEIETLRSQGDELSPEIQVRKRWIKVVRFALESMPDQSLAQDFSKARDQFISDAKNLPQADINVQTDDKKVLRDKIKSAMGKLGHRALILLLKLRSIERTYALGLNPAQVLPKKEVDDVIRELSLNFAAANLLAERWESSGSPEFLDQYLSHVPAIVGLTAYLTGMGYVGYHQHYFLTAGLLASFVAMIYESPKSGKVTQALAFPADSIPALFVGIEKGILSLVSANPSKNQLLKLYFAPLRKSTLLGSARRVKTLSVRLVRELVATREAAEVRARDLFLSCSNELSLPIERAP